MKAPEQFKSRNTVAVALAGGILVMLILVLGTIWMGRSAKLDTEAAVRSVSLLYLDELAGRREQVVAENLQDRVTDMQTALELMTEEDLRKCRIIRKCTATSTSHYREVQHSPAIGAPKVNSLKPEAHNGYRPGRGSPERTPSSIVSLPSLYLGIVSFDIETDS